MFERLGGVSFQDMFKVLENKKHLRRKDTHTMTKDNVIDFRKPDRFVDDPITDVLRTGARKLLTEALEAEIEGFLSQYRELRDNQDRQRVVRNGYLPEREIQTGIGPVAVKVPLPGIANRIMNQDLFGLNHPYCPLTFEKQKVWKN